jgi:aspartate racemase
MKTIGLIGGLSWLSTVDYYRILNETVNQRLGGVHAAKIILNSVNFGEIKELTLNDDWQGIAAIICDAARKTELAGADCLLIGANTMHKIADEVQQSINIPVIHIANVTARAINRRLLKKVALLGTKYTMELEFYANRLAASGIQTIIPPPAERAYVNAAIYEEMGKGLFLPQTKEKFISIIEGLKAQGAEGVILGCTEIPILIKQADSVLPVFDTTLLHATAAVDFALG